MLRIFLTVACVAGLFAQAAGCGNKDPFQGQLTSSAPGGREAKKTSPQEGQKLDPGKNEQSKEAAGGEGQQKKQPPNEVQRRIKYTAEIHLIADNLTTPENKLKELIKSHRGYVAKSEVSGSESTGRQGFWRVRIPVSEFDAFRDDVLQLGEMTKNTSDSEDLTEEYYDLESHIKNRQAEVEGLRKLLDKAADKMENFLVVRSKLYQVQEEIERKQGRLKLLENLTDLTTISITIRERQKFVKEKGPELTEKPTFGMRVEKAFTDSWDSLKSLGAGLAIAGVVVAPWLPFVLLIAVPSWILVRRRMMVTRVASPVAKPVVSPPA